MTAYVIEIDKDWVYLEVDRQIKFRARYHIRQGSRHPVPGSNVRLTFIRRSSQSEGRIPGMHSELPPLVEIADS